MPPGPNVSGSVAELFATLGLDTRPLTAALSEAEAMIKSAGSDMSLSLGSLQARLAQVTTELTGGSEATTAYGAALQAQGISTRFAADASGARAVALNAERNALEGLILSEKELIAAAAYEAEFQALLKADTAAMIERANQEAQATAIMAAREKEYAALWQSLLAEREAAAAAEADDRVGLANQVAIGTARAEAITTAAMKTEVNARILLANQYADAVYRTALIEKEAEAASGVGIRGSLGVGSRGITPRAAIGGTAMIAAAATAFGVFELTHITEESAKAARETDNLSQKLGITWNEARVLQQTAELAGVEINGLATSAFHLAEALQESDGKGKKVAETLAKMGVTGSTSGELLLSVLDNLSKIADQTERQDKLHQIFQRQSQALVPLVSKLAEFKSIAALVGETVDEQMTKKLEAAAVSFGVLGIAWDNYKQKLASGPFGSLATAGALALSSLLSLDPLGMQNALGINQGGGRGTVNSGKPVLAPVKTDAQVAQENRVLAISLTTARDHAVRLLAIEEESAEARKALHKISEDQFLAIQLDINRRREEAQKEFEQKMLDIEVNKPGERDERILAMDSKFQDQRLALDTKYANEKAVRQFNAHEKLLEDIRKFNEKLNNYDQKKFNEQQAIEARSENLTINTVQKTKDVTQQAGQDFINMLQLAAKIDQETANRVNQRNTAYSKLHQTIQDLMDKDEARFIRADIAAKHQSEVVKQTARQLESEIKTIAGGLSDLILEGGKFGDTMEKAMKQSLRTILQDLIQVGFGALLRTIFNTGSALNDLGKRLESVFGIGQGLHKLPYGGGVTGLGGASLPITTSVPDAQTPPFMTRNTGAIEKNTAKVGDAVSATGKEIAVTNTDIGATTTSTKVEQANTGSMNENTRAMDLLTKEVANNSVATIANTNALWANTEALYALTAALAYKSIFGGGGGGGVNIGVNLGGGGNGPNGYQLDPTMLGGNWDWLYNLPIGGGNWEGASPSAAGMMAADGRRGAVIDLRGSHFYAQATEAQTTQMLNKVTDKLRLNRIRV